MKRVSVKRKYYTENKLPEFLDAENANLFDIYAKARFQV
jgi:hypothetical protein